MAGPESGRHKVSPAPTDPPPADGRPTTPAPEAGLDRDTEVPDVPRLTETELERESLPTIPDSRPPSARDLDTVAAPFDPDAELEALLNLPDPVPTRKR